MTEPINLEESDRRFSARPLYRADPDRVLRILAESQFEDPFLAFRELYANALDAVRNKHDARIILQVGADRIAVEDNGPGLDDAGLDALTRLGASTRRGKDAVGRFGIGFASVFDPTLGVQRVRFVAHRQGAAVKGVEIQFVPDLGGGVSITIQPAEVPHLGGSRVEVWFDVSRAPEDRVARTQEVFRTHAAYTGVETELDGQCLGKSLADYIRDEVKSGRIGLMERNIVAASALEGALGVAGIDPGRFDCRVRAYLRGLYVCELIIPRPVGKPWPRGLFGAVNAEGLDLVASRNGFINNQKFKDFLDELQSLGHETAYRVLRHYEATGDSYARVVLLDALRRGLKTSTPETLITGADDIFSCALIRTPLFEAWSESRKFSFEELVDLDREGMFRALSYRPSSDDLNAGVVIRADDSLDRDIFRRLSGMRDMPA
ncbi:MAG: ATP-binding protein, partial [Myxococcales bacterium]|nr:ATP-binding protein [Myxococcales bacterium]